MSHLRLGAAALLIAVAYAAAESSAATWDGGSGVWSTSVGMWDGGQVWIQGNSAVFGSPNGTVTLGENISASTITFNVGNGHVIDLNGFNLTLAGATSGHSSHVITNNTGTTSTLTIVSPANSAVRMDGNLNVVKEGANLWVPSNVHLFSGTLTVKDGTVRIDGTLNSRFPNLSGVRLEGPGVLSFNANGNFSGDIELVGTNTGLLPNNSIVTLDGDISGSGALRRTGTQGTLILTGNNSYTGATVVVSGGSTLIAGSDNAFGNTSGITGVNGASTIGFQGDVTIGAKPMTLRSATGVGGKGTLHSFSGVNSFAGNITMHDDGGGTTAAPAMWQFGAEAGSSLNLTGEITGSTGKYFTKVGPGTIQLSGNNSYRGRTIVRNGTLLIGANAPKGTGDATIGAENIGALGNANSTGAANTTANRSHVWLGDSGTQTTDNIAFLINGSFEVERPLTVFNFNSAGITTIGGLNTSGTAVFTGEIELNRSVILSAAPGGQVDFRPDTFNAYGQALGTGIISGAHGVTIDGGGTVRLAANNTYSGTTTVAAGELIVNGSPINQGTYVVQSGARLGGDGVIGLAAGNSVSVSGNPGALSPGDAGYIPAVTTPGIHAASASYSAGLDANTVGTLTIAGNVQLDGYLLLDVLASGNADFLNVGGDLTLNDTTSQIEINGQTDLSLLDFAAFGFDVGDRLELVAANNITGEFSNFIIGETGTDAGGLGFLQGLEDGTLFLEFVPAQAVPEPRAISIWSLAAIIALGVAVTAHRKR